MKANISKNLSKIPNDLHLHFLIEHAIACVDSYQRILALLPPSAVIGGKQQDEAYELSIRLSFLLDHGLSLTPIFNLEDQFADTIEQRKSYWKRRADEAAEEEARRGGASNVIPIDQSSKIL